MTSLIGGAVYLGYKKAVAHKHNKRKQVNFERWEDLRDNHDDERRRSSMNIDERPPASRGRTSAWDEELPGHLKVERRSYDESASVRRPWEDPNSRMRQESESRSQRNLSEESFSAPRRSTSVERRTEKVEPEEWHTPGGFMAELIERGR